MIFGEIEVERLAYRALGMANLYPSDAVLNLPAEKHSHGLRELAAIEAARGSFGEAPGRSSATCPRPTACGKWLTASIVEVVKDVFEEVCRRDPHHRRPFVALVDGNPQQIARIETEAVSAGSMSPSRSTSYMFWRPMEGGSLRRQLIHHSSCHLR